MRHHLHLVHPPNLSPHTPSTRYQQVTSMHMHRWGFSTHMYTHTTHKQKHNRHTQTVTQTNVHTYPHKEIFQHVQIMQKPFEDILKNCAWPPEKGIVCAWSVFICTSPQQHPQTWSNHKNGISWCSVHWRCVPIKQWGQTTCGAHTCTQTDTIRTSLSPFAALEPKCMVHITYGQTA